jgi:hypothetical protein
MREQRSGDMRFGVLLLAELRLRQIVAAVEDPPVIQALLELVGGNERRQAHGSYSGPNWLFYLPYGREPSSLRCSHSWKCTSASSMGDW